MLFEVLSKLLICLLFYDLFYARLDVQSYTTRYTQTWECIINGFNALPMTNTLCKIYKRFHLFLNYACDLRPVSRISVNKYTFMTLFFLCLCLKKNKREKNVQSVWSTSSLLLLCVCKIWRHRLYDVILSWWMKPISPTIKYTSARAY